MPVFGQKKRQFCQNYTILWAKKINRMLFFPIFHEKTILLMPIFCQKNVHSLKTQCSHAHILSKKRPFSQKHSIVMSFFQIFIKNPLLLCPYLVKETSILLKLCCSMDQSIFGQRNVDSIKTIL